MKKALLASLLFITQALAQLPQNWSPNFPAANTVGTVYAIAETADAYYVGGSFTKLAGVSANGIARVDKTTGTVTPLGAGLTGGTRIVNAVAVLGTDVYIGGTFTAVDGVIASRVAKWNGSSWSALGSGANGSVNAMAVLGSELFIGGTFTSVGGVGLTARLAKWNGSTWLAAGAGFNTTSVPTGGLAVVGTELFVGRGTQVQKWDGSAWSNVGPTTGGIGGIAVQNANSVYIVNNTDCRHWNGTAWTTLKTFDEVATEIAVVGSDVYVGGQFTNYLERWDGSAWQTVGTTGVTNYLTMLANVGGAIFASGDFTMTDGVNTPGLARWNGSVWSSIFEDINGGLDADGYSIVELNGKIYVSGGFTIAGKIAANGVACYDKPTNTWSALPGAHPFSTLVVHNGELHAFYWVDEPAPPYHFIVAKWTGTSWITLGTLEGTSQGTPASIGGALYIVGNFSSVNGTPINHIAKWNGTAWSDAGAGITLNADSMVQSICQAGSQLYASTFNNELVGVDQVQSSHILQWNGSAWVTHTANINPLVQTMIAMGNDLVIGGYFTSINGVPCDNHVARWNGSTWSALGTGVNGSVNVLKYTHGLLYAGTQVDSEYLREWNGSSWEEVGGGPSWDVWDITVLGDELFVTGSFTQAGWADIPEGFNLVAPSSNYIGSYPLTPEIAIEQPVNTNLVDGSASIDFGTAPQGSSLNVLTFTLRSAGTIPLLNLSMTKDGTNSSDFTITALPTVLEDNTSTTFTVTFTPSGTGTRSAALHIVSTDADESMFDITLTGTGTPASGSIDEWRQFWFGTTSNTGSAADTSDPDGDGVANLMEFGLGLNPTLASVPVFQTQVSGSNLEFTYTRSTAAVLAGRTFQVPWTQTLNGSDWNYADTTQTILSDNGTTQTVKATVPKGSLGRRFVRLEVQ